MPHCHEKATLWPSILLQECIFRNWSDSFVGKFNWIDPGPVYRTGPASNIRITRLSVPTFSPNVDFVQLVCFLSLDLLDNNSDGKVSNKNSFFALREKAVGKARTTWKQGCQIFLDTIYQNGQYVRNVHKIDKMAVIIIPNDHKIY
jgi:hypothetical protein